MHWSTLTMIFVAAVFGAPAPSPFTIAPALMDQGDGFYMATFDHAGVPNVTFTPMVRGDEIVAGPVSEHLTARGPDGTTCGHGKSYNVKDLEAANTKLAQDNDGNWYVGDTWGWV
jgi:hypothetical protein